MFLWYCFISPVQSCKGQTVANETWNKHLIYNEYEGKKKKKECKLGTSGSCSALGPASSTATVNEEFSARRLATAKPLLYRESKSLLVLSKEGNGKIRVAPTDDDKVIGQRLLGGEGGVGYPSQVQYGHGYPTAKVHDGMGLKEDRDMGTGYSAGFDSDGPFISLDLGSILLKLF